MKDTVRSQPHPASCAWKRSSRPRPASTTLSPFPPPATSSAADMASKTSSSSAARKGYSSVARNRATTSIEYTWYRPIKGWKQCTWLVCKVKYKYARRVEECWKNSHFSSLLGLTFDNPKGFPNKDLSPGIECYPDSDSSKWMASCRISCYTCSRKLVETPTSLWYSKTAVRADKLHTTRATVHNISTRPTLRWCTRKQQHQRKNNKKCFEDEN